jgi:N-acetylmuramoyl-L-alanine amidase
MKIMIDPGHGGKDPGALGPTGLAESVVVLSVSKMLARALEELEASTQLTRHTEYFVDLGERCDLANEWSADYFVSIHCNSNGSTAVGIETLYKSEQGKVLATPVHKSLVDATLDRDRGLKHRTDLYVLNGTHMPAILCEIGFISHPATETKLAMPEYQDLVASAIAIGLAGYQKGNKGVIA